MLVVCVLLLILISAAYLFSERMLINNVASTGTVQRRQAVSLSESGVAYVQASLQSVMAQATEIEWPSRWNGEVKTSDSDSFGEFQVSFWDERRDAWKAGVSDESCKLNLNQLPLDTLYGPEARRMLMCVPGMTLVIADSILDWMDEDEIQREFGAESSYYRTQKPPRFVRNKRLKVLDDLRGVRGVTPKLLYGARKHSQWEQSPRLADLNPASERSGAGNLALREKDFGFSAFLTVHGGISVLRMDGEPRILINQDDLVSLYDEIMERLGEDVATYLVAYRMFGPKDKTLLATDDYLIDEVEQTQRRAIRQASDEDEADRISIPTERKGSLTIDKEGVFLIRSIYDLIGVDVEYKSKDGSLLIESPWPENEYTFNKVMPVLNEDLCFLFGTPIMAQVNVNQAPIEVLRSIPGISDDLVDQILITRQTMGIDADSNNAIARSKQFLQIDWLRSAGVMNLKQMRVFAPYITNLGTAFRFISTGISQPSNQSSHQEVVLDFRYHSGNVAFSNTRSLRETMNVERGN